MAMNDHELEQRTRHAYERGRVKFALLAALPVVVVAAICSRVAHETMLGCGVGAAMFVLAVVFFWRGRGLGRGVLPGIAAGSLPFVAMLAAQMYGHSCTGSTCMVCIPVTALSAAIAGIVIGRFARRSNHVAASWVSAAVFATLIGSIACACVGVGGLIGLVAGLAVGSVPLVLQPQANRA